MWTGETMTLTESLAVSGIGMLVVIGELLILAIVLVLFSKLLAASSGRNSQTAPNMTASDHAIDEETYAILLSVISAEAGAEPEKFRITEIKELM